MQQFFNAGLLKNVERVLFDVEKIRTRVAEIAADIMQNHGSSSLTVISVLNGGIIFTADLLRALPLPLELGVISAASYHGKTQSSKNVLLETAALPDLRGRDLLLVDDILDT